MIVKKITLILILFAENVGWMKFPISIINEKYLFIVPIIHRDNHVYYANEVWLISSSYTYRHR